MASFDELAQTVANLNMTPTKVFVPEVGHRMVTKSLDGKILDTGNNDFTDKFKIPEPKAPKEVKKGDPRSDRLSEIANNMPEINSVLLKGTQTLKSFQEMKQSILNDIDTDQESVNALDSIEKALQHFIISYSEKKESLRKQFLAP